MIYFRLKNNRHIVLSSLSLFSLPPQRIIDAIHAPEMLRRSDFSSPSPPLFSRFFFPLPSPPSPTPSAPGALEALLLIFFLPFPLRLSVTDWQKEHMTGVQMADKNKIRHVMRY